MLISDGLLDLFEQQIIDAHANDEFTSIQTVLPHDDFDKDGFTNLTQVRHFFL